MTEIDSNVAHTATNASAANVSGGLRGAWTEWLVRGRESLGLCTRGPVSESLRATARGTISESLALTLTGGSAIAIESVVSMSTIKSCVGRALGRAELVKPSSLVSSKALVTATETLVAALSSIATTKALITTGSLLVHVARMMLLRGALVAIIVMMIIVMMVAVVVIIMVMVALVVVGLVVIRVIVQIVRFVVVAREVVNVAHGWRRRLWRLDGQVVK